MTDTEMLAEFSAGYGFKFDDFQIKACQRVLDGSGVLVAAPTGSGKTVVGEFGCWLALQTGKKCFYTTPIKALSNQKYHDLVARYGADSVGLLTGDQSVNSEADVVVMTTEVLRNMLYAGSRTLQGLGYVVMDEVHYLADRFRGAVWEEVILGLAPDVDLICLSATVSNAEEFGEWLDEVRGDVAVVVSEKRPVDLAQHMLVNEQVIDLFVNGKVNQKLLKLERGEARNQRDDSRRPRGRSGKGKRNVSFGSGRYGGAAASRYRDRGDDRRKTLRPSRGQMVRGLAKENLLPAIVFVFSRAGCDGAVQQLLGTNIVLTNSVERSELMRIAEKYSAQLTYDDKLALGWDNFVEALGRGIAAHHAGLLPAFKAIIEEGFTRGLIKVVFATETLALGINMPARTVLIERLVKYNGEAHVDITPGEYTQLTGRAGRRGIDTEGHAVVAWQPGIDPRAVAGLASKRTYPLRSSFTPNYNMAVNLVGTIGRDRARALLEQSFAQFQADRKVVKAARLHATEANRAKELWEQATCSKGDFREYANLREQISQLENEVAKLRKGDKRAEVLDFLFGLEPGDVIWVPAGKHKGWAAVADPGRPPVPHPLVMTQKHIALRLTDGDFPVPGVVRSRVRVPKKFDQRSAADRKAFARSLDARLETIDRTPPPASKPGRDKQLAAEIDELRAQLREHPCHSCPDREAHARSAEQAIRIERKVAPKPKSRNSISAQFDRICLVLDSLGYLDGDVVTDDGKMLQRIYSELDLVVAECVRQNVFVDLDVPSLAAVLSTLVYEARRADSGRFFSMPDRDSEAVQTQVRRIWRDINKVERDARVERSRSPEIGFAELAYRWAAGEGLADLLDDSDMPAGDFVRWVRQVIDLASQLSNAPGAQPIRETCRGVVNSMRRDIVDFGAE